MNNEYYLKFLKLRQLGKIGRIWPSESHLGYYVANQGAHLWYEHQNTFYLTFPQIERLIDVLLAIEEYQNELIEQQRKPMGRAFGIIKIGEKSG